MVYPQFHELPNFSNHFSFYWEVQNIRIFRTFSFVWVTCTLVFLTCSNISCHFVGEYFQQQGISPVTLRKNQAYSTVNMSYWPSVRSRWLDIGQVLFLGVMDQEEVKVHKLTEKEWSKYQAILTKQAWSIKDLLYGFRGNYYFFLAGYSG